MPIPFREYKDELEPAGTKLLAVIEQTPYKAYSLSDLTPYDDNLLMRILLTLAVQSQLKSLEEKELVKSKKYKRDNLLRLCES